MGHGARALNQHPALFLGTRNRTGQQTKEEGLTLGLRRGAAEPAAAHLGPQHLRPQMGAGQQHAGSQGRFIM